MKKAILLSGLTALSLTGFTAASFAQEGGDTPPASRALDFSQLDVDGNGELTLEEMQAHGKARAQERFAAADTDGDGKLSEADVAAHMKAMRAEREAQRDARRAKHFLAERDADGDGLLSIDEMAPKGARAEKMFGRVDRDGDGVISAEEFQAMQDRFAERGMHPHGDHGPRKRGEHGGDHRDGHREAPWKHGQDRG
ncbi:EF-hand domain-containing protein [Pseudooceanicola sp. HF7]|uniref:EF-hand domain-containing protein n=1 Tax=Pseudooceanicola sp. HF7 TaxID=2721560 RepID=UPI00142FEDC7|nr:EF-hand domain-containing protein [Pseudooceanicola sp. HF7]NIZ10134.1 calcium-binding protein [Pseudooceanicola sp. HF7]